MTPPATTALAEERRRIDDLDRRIARLLALRLRCARRAAAARERRGESRESRDADREREVIRNVTRDIRATLREDGDAPLQPYDVEEIYEPIFAATRGLR